METTLGTRRAPGRFARNTRSEFTRDANREFPSLRPFPSLDERIRKAHAERSVAAGYAIGSFLAAMWRLAVHR